MPTISEKRKEVIVSIQSRLNKMSMKQEERALLEKVKNFRQLLQLGILLPNEKVGSHYNGYWLKKINGSNWAFKIAKELGIPRAFFLEIINERLATAYGIHTIKSKIVKLSYDSNYYGIISEDYRDEKYIVVSGVEIVTEYLKYLEKKGYFEERFGVKSIEEVDEDVFYLNSLPVIYQALTYHFTKKAEYPESFYSHEKSSSIVEEIYNELVRRFAYAYMTKQKDFHLGNWEILENANAAYLTPMYDLEMSFLDTFYDKKNTSLRATMDAKLTIDEDFSKFINQSEQNRLLVNRMHYMITPLDIMSFMEKRNPSDIEIPLSIKKQVIAAFTNHYMKIEDMLTNKNRLKKDSK